MTFFFHLTLSSSFGRHSMTYLLFQGLATLCISVCSVISSKQGYHYPPPATPTFNDAPPPAASVTGPATGPGPVGPTGVGPTGPVGPSALGVFPGPFGYGPFPFPGLYGPFPGPSPFFPPYPFHPLSKFGHHGYLLNALREKIPSFIQSFIFAIIAATLLTCIQSVVLPFFGIYLARMGRAIQETDQRALDMLNRSVRQAITRGACLDRIACNMGRRANEYSVSPSVLKMLKSYEKPNSLLEVFRMAASGDVASCEEYSCWFVGGHNSDDLSPYKRDHHNTNET